MPGNYVDRKYKELEGITRIILLKQLLLIVSVIITNYKKMIAMMDIVPNPVINASINFCHCAHRIRTLYFHLSSLYFHALPMTSSQLIVTFRQMLVHYSKRTTICQCEPFSLSLPPLSLLSLLLFLFLCQTTANLFIVLYLFCLQPRMDTRVLSHKFSFTRK